MEPSAASNASPSPSGSAGPPRLSGVPAGARRALVVGASSGIGEALVRRLASEGFAVAALARRAERLEELARELEPLARASGGRVVTRAHDVLDTDEVPRLFEELVCELGGLELVVFAAGIMPKVGRDEYDTETDLEVLAVNVAGLVAWCNAAASYFRTRREGTLVGISSIAGDRGRKGNPMYCASKAALNTYLEALRNRLAEVGVHVCTIKPGYVDTAMTRGLPGLFWLISADQAARQILAAARNRINVRYVPERWRLVGCVIRSIPSFLFRHLNV